MERCDYHQTTLDYAFKNYIVWIHHGETVVNVDLEGAEY